MNQEEYVQRRQMEKAERQRYREIARQQVLLDSDCKVHIDEHTHVHPMSDGAFVEVHIWIPKEKLCAS